MGHTFTAQNKTRLPGVIAGLFCLLLFSGIGMTAQPPSPLYIRGVVTDSNGAAVSNASVRFIPSNQTGTVRTAVTASDGRFVIEIPDDRGTLIVDAQGFRSYKAMASVGDDVSIILSPAPVNGLVTVTGTETRVEETAASVVLLGRPDLDVSGALTLDDRLRQVPGFSLFRRAGSRTANPTTQGVSLRGVGASGASRALVLADGVPLNDPFGGWVYWGRVPSESISQVEILRGAAGDLYGSSAIGGVVSVITRPPAASPFASIETSYGSQRTPFVSAYSSIASSGWSGSLAGEFFRTDGFIPVDEPQRGGADTRANVSRWAIVPFVQRTFRNRDRIFASAEFFREERENGTRLQTNDTNLKAFSGGADWQLTSRDFLTVRVSGGIQSYNQTFSAISADRNSETLNRLQRVPTNYSGISGKWTANRNRNVFFAGAELRRVHGHSDETGIAAGVPTSRSDAGGRELTGGIFAGAIVPVGSKITVSGGFRFDRWRNRDGFARSVALASGIVTETFFPDRSESAFSPRISILYRITRRVSVSATFAKGFRRPTLNELYRNFRVGEVLTLANANLRAERAANFETAANVNAFEQRVNVRAGMFCTAIDGNVANVTLAVTPNLITRQRQNIGSTRSCGLEADGNFQVSREFRISGGYLFVDPRVTDFPANTALEGLRIPQVPRHQFAMQAALSVLRKTTISAQFRAVGPQFDDDQNQFRLAGFFTVDVFAARRLGSRVEVFAAAENLSDSRIEAGRTPVLTLGSPRAFRIGLRLRIGGN
jgi:outer membrane receptor protein involved in Fe transport